MTSENNHIGQNFNDFLKEENIEIREDEIRKRAKAIKENTLKYGFTCLDNKGEIIPNYKIFQIDNKLIINESEVEND